MRAVKKPLNTLVLTACLGLMAGFQAAVATAQKNAESDAPEPELVDRIVAVVDEDPILSSDLDRAIGLGLATQGAEESDEQFRRRVLDLMIDERLRAHEVDRFGFTEISLSEVETATVQLIAGFSSEEAFEQRLEELALTRDEVRQILARQVMVLTYVDERLGPRVFVSLDDIREYYDSVLAPEMEATGQPLPEIESVREQIRAVLREQRLNQEIEAWTDELRLEADIEDYFDRSADASAEVVIGVRGAPDPGP